MEDKYHNVEYLRTGVKVQQKALNDLCYEDVDAILRKWSRSVRPMWQTVSQRFKNNNDEY